MPAKENATPETMNLMTLHGGGACVTVDVPMEAEGEQKKAVDPAVITALVNAISQFIIAFINRPKQPQAPAAK